MVTFVLALATLLATNSESAEPRVEVWAGHQVLNGKRKIPLYGEKETHTENYFLAEVYRTPSRIDIRQKLCRFEVRPIKGVLPSMKPETIARLPKSHFVLEEKADGSLAAAPWTTGWGAEDVDGDGSPGATISISGTSCSGDLHISSQTMTSLISGHAAPDGVAGQISVRLKQKVLSAKGLCLKLMAGDSDETQTGWFAYRRIEPGSTCHSLEGKPWPAKAGAAQKAALQ
jgi:hypothetical protein